MKSPDEIKKGLACAGLHTCPDEKCPYYASCAPCELQVQDDALVLIQQLQAENAEKDVRIQQLEKRVIHLEALNQSNLTTITMQERTRARLQERISQLEADNDRLTDEVCNAYNIQNEQLARIKQLEAELEDMTARYKIADDCTKKKGEMNEKLYAELSAVKAERDAAVADLKDCVTEAAQGDDFDCCFACKYNNEYGGCDRPNYTIEACGVEDFDNKWTWRGVQKEE